jgi:DNA invertase Pin-like site-specific DNA recombinase
VHAATYIDIGFADTDLARPSLRRMLMDVEAGKIDLVVIAGAWNTFSTSVVELEEIFTILEWRRVPVLSATGLLDPATADGRAMLHLVSAAATLEARKRDRGGE